MVVAEDGGARVGESVELTVTNMLQTSAGRMIFGRVVRDQSADERPGGPGPDEPSAFTPADAAPADASDGDRRTPPAVTTKGPPGAKRVKPSSRRNPRR